MDQAVRMMQAGKDIRLEQVQEQLLRFTVLDFSPRVPVSGKGDDIDAIILALNTLGDELSSRNITEKAK